MNKFKESFVQRSAAGFIYSYCNNGLCDDSRDKAGPCYTWMCLSRVAGLYSMYLSVCAISCPPSKSKFPATRLAIIMCDCLQLLCLCFGGGTVSFAALCLRIQAMTAQTAGPVFCLPQDIEYRDTVRHQKRPETLVALETNDNL